MVDIFVASEPDRLRLVLLEAAVWLHPPQHKDQQGAPTARHRHQALLLSFWRIPEVHEAYNVFYRFRPSSKAKWMLWGNTHTLIWMNYVITFAFIYFFSCCLVKPENKFQCAKQVRGIYVWYLMCENYDHFTCSMKWLGFNFIHINLNCIASNSGQLVIFLRFLCIFVLEYVNVLIFIDR